MAKIRNSLCKNAQNICRLKLFLQSFLLLLIFSTVKLYLSLQLEEFQIEINTKYFNRFSFYYYISAHSFPFHMSPFPESVKATLREYIATSRFCIVLELNILASSYLLGY